MRVLVSPLKQEMEEEDKRSEKEGKKNQQPLSPRQTPDKRKGGFSFFLSRRRRTTPGEKQNIGTTKRSLFFSSFHSSPVVSVRLVLADSLLLSVGSALLTTIIITAYVAFIRTWPHPATARYCTNKCPATAEIDCNAQLSYYLSPCGMSNSLGGYLYGMISIPYSYAAVAVIYREAFGARSRAKTRKKVVLGTAFFSLLLAGMYGAEVFLIEADCFSGQILFALLNVWMFYDGDLRESLLRLTANFLPPISGIVMLQVVFPILLSPEAAEERKTVNRLFISFGLPALFFSLSFLLEQCIMRLREREKRPKGERRTQGGEALSFPDSPLLVMYIVYQQLQFTASLSMGRDALLVIAVSSFTSCSGYMATLAWNVWRLKGMKRSPLSRLSLLLPLPAGSSSAATARQKASIPAVVRPLLLSEGGELGEDSHHLEKDEKKKKEEKAEATAERKNLHFSCRDNGNRGDAQASSSNKKKTTASITLARDRVEAVNKRRHDHGKGLMASLKTIGWAGGGGRGRASSANDKQTPAENGTRGGRERKVAELSTQSRSSDEQVEEEKKGERRFEASALLWKQMATIMIVATMCGVCITTSVIPFRNYFLTRLVVNSSCYKPDASLFEALKLQWQHLFLVLTTWMLMAIFIYVLELLQLGILRTWQHKRQKIMKITLVLQILYCPFFTVSNLHGMLLNTAADHCSSSNAATSA